METAKPINLFLNAFLLSKIIFQTFLTPIPNYIGTELEKNQKGLLWNNSTPMIKHDNITKMLV